MMDVQNRSRSRLVRLNDVVTCMLIPAFAPVLAATPG